MRKGDSLVPEMALDGELIQRFNSGERIKVTLSTGRSPPKLRWYWAYLGRIVKATACAGSPEALHDVIKLEVGMTSPVKVKGFTVLVPKSVAFSSMSEPEFDDFLKLATEWIAANLHLTPEDVFGDTNGQ